MYRDHPNIRGRVWEFELENACVLVRSDTHDVYTLSPTAAHAWRLLNSGNALNDAASEFAKFHGIPTDVARRDLELTWSEWETTLLAPSVGLDIVPRPSPPDANLNSALFSRSYCLNDTSVRVALYDEDLVDEIAPRLQPLLVHSDADPSAIFQAIAANGSYHVFLNGSWVATREHPADARVAFLQELTKVVHGDREWAAILHAAACGTSSECVIFPAATHCGKTTLAAMLMQSGLKLYADDSVALDRENLAIPAMPFSLMVREGSWPLFCRRSPGFENLPIYNRYGQNVRFLRPVAPPNGDKAQARAIVFSQWEAGTQMNIKPLNSLEALIRLNNSGFWFAPDRSSIQNFIDWLRRLPIYEMVYSDADDAVTFVNTLLGG